MLTFEQISAREQSIINRQWYLGALFFIGAAIFAWFYIHVVSGPTEGDNGQAAGAKLLVAYIIFAMCLGLGYLYHLWLNRCLAVLLQERQKLWALEA